MNQRTVVRTAAGCALALASVLASGCLEGRDEGGHAFEPADDPGVRVPDWRWPEAFEEERSWVVVADETIPAGLRGISPDPGPSLAVDEEGRPSVVFTYRSEGIYALGYAVRRDAGWDEERSLGESSYFAYALAGQGRLRIAASTPSQYESVVWETGGEGSGAVEFDHPLGFAGTDAQGNARLLGLSGVQELVLTTEEEAGWSTEPLFDAGPYPRYTASVAPGGTVGLVFFRPDEGELRFVESSGRDELIVAYEPRFSSPNTPRLAYAGDGTPFAALTIVDRALTPDGDELRLYRLDESSASYEVLAVDADPPGVERCPEARGALCVFETVAHRALALVPTEDGVLPVVERLALEVRRERECVEWGFIGGGCAPSCVDEGGPQGAWQEWVSEVAVAAPELLVEGSPVALDPPLPGGREVAAVLDRRGRLHLALYQRVSDDWEDGDAVRYLRLERR